MNTQSIKITTYTLMLSSGLVMAADRCSENRFYIGIDGGYSMSSSRTNFNPYNGTQGAPSNFFIVPVNTTFQKDIEDSGMIGGFLGYRLHDNLSLNLNYDYRKGFKWQVPVNSSDIGANDVIFFTDSIRIQTLFLNAILQPSVCWSGISTYVNGGIGFSINEVGTIHDVNLLTLRQATLNPNRFSQFAWNVGLGVEYAITDCLHYSLGYRLVNAGRLESGSLFTGSGGLGFPTGTVPVTAFRASHLLLNEVITGLSWQF